EAMERLSYERDRATLAEAVPLRKRTSAVVVLRHAKARSRTGWRRPDRERPLVSLGHDQAERLVPRLTACDVSRVVTAAATRCTDTVRPYADSTGWPPEELDGLTEDAATVES